MSDGNPVDPTQTNSVVAPAAAPVEAPVEPKPVDPNSLFADQLAGIKTDDGRQKYADVQTALASVPHAQTHIQAQTQEIAELKEQLAKQQGMEAVLEQLKSQQATPETPSVQGIDETTVDSIINARLQERETAALQNANTAKVLTNLQEKFGDKAEARFNEQAESLGVSVGFLSDLARKAPEAVLAYFKNASPSPSNPTQGTFNTTVLDSNPPADDQSHMRIFKPSMSGSLQKWKAVAQT